MHVEGDQERGARAPRVVDSDVADPCFPAPNDELPVEVARLIRRAVSTEPFPSWLCLADLQCVDGLGKLSRFPGAAAEFPEDLPGRGIWTMPWACFVMFRKLMLIPFAVAALGLILSEDSLSPFHPDLRCLGHELITYRRGGSKRGEAPGR